MNSLQLRVATACLLLLALVTSCTVQLAGTDRSAEIQGKVLSDGKAVVGATVAAGATSVTTDVNGAYTLKLTGVSERMTLKVSANGYAPTYSVLDYRGGVYRYSADVTLVAPQSLTVGAAGGTMVVDAGTRSFVVTIAPGAVPEGTRLEVAGFNAGNGPGAMETTESNEMRLQTAGMFYVRAVDPAGKEVAFQGGKGVALGTASDIPVVPDAQDMKTYQMDDQGRWVPGTTTTATGADLLAQQQGFWNADRAYRTACMRGKLNAPNKSCAGERVKAGGLDSLYTQDTAGAGGQFCVEGPQGYTQTLSVGTKSTPVVFPSTPGSCRTNPTACKDFGTLDVGDADCPSSCDKTKVDSPDGCKDKPADNTDPYSFYSYCSQAVPCCPSSNQGCGRTYKSCADSSGGGGYVTSDGKKYWCANGSDQTCVQARAKEVVNYCMN